jgi:hypothetical protein
MKTGIVHWADRRALLLALTLAMGVAAAWAADGDPVPAGKLRIGMNIAAFCDFGSEFPTLDLMKSSRRWLTQNIAWVAKGKNQWDTQALLEE